MSTRGAFFKNVVLVMKALMASQYGLSSAELADHCQLDQRTIQRYLQQMSRFLPISEDNSYGDKRRKRYKLERLPGSGGLPQVVFGLEEIIALNFYRSLLPDTEDLPFHDQLMQAFDKLRLATRPALTSQMDRFAEVFTCYEKNTKSYSGHRETILVLTRAILTRNTIRIWYHAFQSNSNRRYRIDPLRLFFYDGGLYLTAYVHGIREIWNLAVERIEDIELLDDVMFDPPDPGLLRKRNLDAFRIYSSTPFVSRFRFPSHMKPYVEERCWHPSQTLHPQPDGSIELHLQTGGPYDIKRWILSFGSDIEVLEPDWLREQIADELKNAFENYSQS